MSHISYSVYPRYTPGSPAMVRREIAEQVAREEREAIEHHLSGIYGEERRERALRFGLKGIAEVHEVHAHHIIKYDMITNERTDTRDQRKSKARR